VTPYTILAVLAFRKFHMLVQSEQLVSLVNLHDPDHKVNGCRVLLSIFLHLLVQSHAVAQLVEALRYKSEGRGFDSRWCHWNFSLT